ncbi:tetratricopeptide repeat protein [Novipirellula sp. SH528]|uniref:tetratricopeptide repeat protein n=1 Tax=Novipirellula sp. SH528 TaxID=3454466 RepID=UPI003FA18361
MLASLFKTRVTWIVFATALITSQLSSVAEDGSSSFKSAEDAYMVGAAFLNADKKSEARGPLEAALSLAKDNEYRVKCHQALLRVYRGIPEFEPFRDSAEYIIRHSTKTYERSLTRSSLLSFAYNRGQLDALVTRYEKKLDAEPEDEPTVYVLSELYSRSRRDPKRTIELMELLERLSPEDEKPEPGSKQAIAADARMAIQKGNLAREYVRGKEYAKSAQTYQQAAALDTTTESWNLKEAASAWLKAGDRDKAMEMVKQAEKLPAESRNDSLAHFFHRHMGDLYTEFGKPDLAIPHYEVAVQKTTIEGYRTDTQKSLDEARAAAAQ